MLLALAVELLLLGAGPLAEQDRTTVTLVSVGISPSPVSMSAEATSLPLGDSGTMSPYPTVVTVTTAHQYAGPRLGEHLGLDEPLYEALRRRTRRNEAREITWPRPGGASGARTKSRSAC